MLMSFFCVVLSGIPAFRGVGPVITSFFMDPLIKEPLNKWSAAEQWVF